MRSHRALLAVVLAALVAGPAAASVPGPGSAPPPIVAAVAQETPTPGAGDDGTEDGEAAAVTVPRTLARELRAVVARYPELSEAGRLGIAVVAGDGTPVWSLAADEAFLPASSMKSLAAASVLATFGMDGRITTAATATAPVRRDGVLDGDLVVRGLGDPTLTSEDYRRWIHPSRPATAVEDLADAIVAAGVERIRGDLLGDGTTFGVARTAAGWPSRYFADFDAHFLSGLTIDTGRRVQVEGADSGAPSVTIDHEPDPTLHTVEVLADALAERGVWIRGRVRRSLQPTLATFPVATVQSPPMDEVVTFMLRESDNHLADSLLRASAVRALGHGSWQEAGATVRAALHDQGVDTAGLVVSDGSGLSRTDRVTPAQLVGNDLALFDRLGSRWSEMLAQAGRVGTLEGRLLGTSAEARVYAKTGTLADVRARAGHVVAEDGADDDPASHYHFALLANDVEAVAWLGSVVADELALVLTDAMDGCQRRRQVEVELAGAGGSTRTVTRMRPATPESPGPALADGAWERRCADD